MTPSEISKRQLLDGPVNKQGILRTTINLKIDILNGQEIVNHIKSLSLRRIEHDEKRKEIIPNKLTNSMAYGTRRFNAAFTRAL